MRKIMMAGGLLAGLTLAADDARAQWTYKDGVNDGSGVRWATARIQSGSITFGFKCWTNKDLHLLIVTTHPISSHKVGEKASIKVRIDDEDQGVPYEMEIANLGGWLSYIRPRSGDLLSKVRNARTRVVVVIGKLVYVVDGKTSAAAIDQMSARCKI